MRSEVWFMRDWRERRGLVIGMSCCRCSWLGCLWGTGKGRFGRMSSISGMRSSMSSVESVGKGENKRE